ncbi:MAG: glycosyltransferase family 2 protein [Candidatus Thermoplasmatota archaeon]|nr:glycosyltransferase family 2 protein [Candidatus Thermoplasmatota archaeon]
MPNKKVTVLLPALNEERSIRKVINEIPLKALEERSYSTEIVVVDGHSVDRTLEIAAEMGAKCLRQPNKGKGDAVRHAFKHFEGDYLFMLDADSTYPPHHIMEMLPILETGKAHVVMGSRLRGQMTPGSMSRMNLLGNKILTGTANLLFSKGMKISDLCTGMWGFQGDVIQNLASILDAQGFDIEAEMYIESKKRGFNIIEVPIDYDRRDGPSKLGSMRDGARIFSRILREKF